MISVLPSACLIFHAADCTETMESLKQGQEERETEGKTLGRHKRENKWQRGGWGEDMETEIQERARGYREGEQIKKWGYPLDSKGGGGGGVCE